MIIEGKNILVYSCSAKLINFVSNYILQQRAIPFISSTPESAVDLVNTEKIDLIIAEFEYDNNIRNFDAQFSLLKIINTQFIYLPIIVILKKFDQNIAKKLLKAGVVAFFVQPFDLDDLNLEIGKIKYLQSSIKNRVAITENSFFKYSLVINSDEDIIGAVSYNIVEIFRILFPHKKDDLNGIMLAVNEIIMNAVIHGNQRNISSVINIDFLVDYDKIVIIITDEGQGFDYSNLPDPTDSKFILKESGRGIFLTKIYMDEVNFYLNGSRIELIKYLNKKK